MNAQEIIDRWAGVHGVTAEAILSRSRVPAVCEARRAAMVEYHAAGALQREVALAFNRISPATISVAVRARREKSQESTKTTISK